MEVEWQKVSRKYGYHPDESKDEEKNGKKNSSDAGSKGVQAYKRTIPEKYTGDVGDNFMEQMIKKYAIEGGKL